MGNGPSVDAMPADFWEHYGVSYVGTNRCLVLAACQRIHWDAVVIRDSYRAQFADQDIGWQYHEDFWKPAKCWKVGAAHDRGPHCDEYVQQASGFQVAEAYDSNRELLVMRNGSVVLMAINWAWLAGARSIALVGVDYHEPPLASLVAPYDDKPRRSKGIYARRVPKQTERQFRDAVSSIEAAGGSLVNLSPGTALEAVPCADYHAIGL